MTQHDNATRDEAVLSDEIGAAEYLRERLEPRPGDPLYLHLADLRVALERVRTDERIDLLDYGCGGSPYRSLFPNANYVRADFLSSASLDYRIGERSRVPAPDQSFDLVLSTQVLEHVPDPAAYLEESRRMLRPGGRLALTTHGIYEDHGCPYDFQRWTADGLRLAGEKAGFRISEVLKLTCGVRALMFLNRLYRRRFGTMPDLPFSHLMLQMLQALHFQAAEVDSWCDMTYGHQRLAPDSDREQSFYIALLMIGTRAE